MSTIVRVASKTWLNARFKNVILPTRKPNWRVNYKLEWQAKVISKPVQTVLKFPSPPSHPSTLHNHEADFSCRGFRARVNPYSNHIFFHSVCFSNYAAQRQMWLTTARRYKKVWCTWSTVTFQQGPLNQNGSKQKWKTNIYVTRIFILTTSGQIRFKTWNKRLVTSKF